MRYCTLKHTLEHTLRHHCPQRLRKGASRHSPRRHTLKHDYLHLMSVTGSYWDGWHHGVIIENALTHTHKRLCVTQGTPSHGHHSIPLCDVECCNLALSFSAVLILAPLCAVHACVSISSDGTHFQNCLQYESITLFPEEHWAWTIFQTQLSNSYIL